MSELRAFYVQNSLVGFKGKSSRRVPQNKGLRTLQVFIGTLKSSEIAGKVCYPRIHLRFNCVSIAFTNLEGCNLRS